MTHSSAAPGSDPTPAASRTHAAAPAAGPAPTLPSTEGPASPTVATPIPDPLIPAPPAIAKAVEDGMLGKATKPLPEMFLLSVAAGALIGFGFIIFITSQQGMAGSAIPVGLQKIIGGGLFSVGLGMVVTLGADLFTGTTMSFMALLSGRVAAGRFLLHWLVSLVGNFAGAVGLAVMVLWAGTPLSNGGAWGLVALNSSLAKVTLPFGKAFMLGILANIAVCLAVYLATAGKTTFDKVFAVIGPLALFISAGFEHSVANMFMIPMGLLVKSFGGDAFWAGEAVQAAGKTAADYDALTVGSMLWNNLTPVVLGNIVGGAVFVGGFAWLAYRARTVRSEAAKA